MPAYDSAHYLVIREALKEPHSGAITGGAATGGLVGSTFRTYHKAVVFGVSAICSTAGSGGGCKVVVSRTQGVTGTVSLCAITVVNASMAANGVTNLTFTTPLTLTSMGDSVALHGSASAAGDITEFGSVVWRFRYLPPGTDGASDDYTNTQIG